MCQILPKGVVAVLGPSSSPASSSIISNICGEKEVSATPAWGLSPGWQPVPWAQRCHGFSRSGGAHWGLVGVTNHNIKTVRRSGPLLGTHFSPGCLGGGDTEGRFHNRTFKLSCSGSLSPGVGRCGVGVGALGGDGWRERLWTPRRQKSELPRNCFMILCSDTAILAKNAFAGEALLHFIAKIKFETLAV